MSEKGAQRSGINRAFSWVKKVMEITQPTDVPDRVSPLVQPTLDLFGWERRIDQAANTTTTGADAADVVIAAAVPEGIVRYVLYLSASHDDPVAGGLLLSLQVRSNAVDFGLQVPFQCLATPARMGLERPILLEPGQQLLCRSNPAPAALTSMFLRFRFIDLPIGEYMPPL